MTYTVISKASFDQFLIQLIQMEQHHNALHVLSCFIWPIYNCLQLSSAFISDELFRIMAYIIIMIVTTEKLVNIFCKIPIFTAEPLQVHLFQKSAFYQACVVFLIEFCICIFAHISTDKLFIGDLAYYMWQVVSNMNKESKKKAMHILLIIKKRNFCKFPLC